jgi:leucyl aminopeptidase
MPEMEILGFDTNGWLARASITDSAAFATGEGALGTIAIIGENGTAEGVAEAFAEDLAPWQYERLRSSNNQVYEAALQSGPIWLVPLAKPSEPGIHDGYLDQSRYCLARDMVGSVFRYEQTARCKKLVVVFHGASKEEKLGALVGLELGSYTYKDPNRKRLPELFILGCSQKMIDEARAIGVATNLARHLVNSPANLLNPTTYSEIAQQLFQRSPQTKVQVWDSERCQKENMNLLCAVGQAAEHQPCFIHLRYRPKSGRKKSTVAYVGKGITFDSGGLDIKPSSGMRLMKKDMGGSAAVFGLAYWLDRSGYDHPSDLYLAVAENAVSAAAFRPGDVIKARNGVSVEIDNTDAEGRLVLADALCVATEEKNKERPKQVINLATLTGAMRVALGQKIAGYFANDDDLADQIADAAFAHGEPAWRMPLYQPYRDQMNTTVADLMNSGGRFGGAITAALFLERFVHGLPWGHLDIYTWSERPEGYCIEPGGNGQGVQMLIGFVQGKS